MRTLRTNKRESALRSAFMEKLTEVAPLAIALRHEDVRRNAVPDMSFTLHGNTSWCEFKHGTPEFESRGDQELMMQRLSERGFAAYYIIWLESTEEGKHTYLVHPFQIIRFKEARDHHTRNIYSALSMKGFDHSWAANRVVHIHQVGRLSHE